MQLWHCNSRDNKPQSSWCPAGSSSMGGKDRRGTWANSTMHIFLSWTSWWPYRVGGNPVFGWLQFWRFPVLFPLKDFWPILRDCCLGATGSWSLLHLSPQPWPAGIPSVWVSLHGSRPIFLIKQLGEGCSYLPICSLSSGMGEAATSCLIGDVGYVSSGKDDCVLLAGSSLACLSMVMHSLVFKKASFKIHRCRKRLRRWIPSLWSAEKQGFRGGCRCSDISEVFPDR